MKSQSQIALEKAQKIDAKLKALEETRILLRNQLRDFFHCGPRMTRGEQLKFLAEFFAFPELK